MNAPLVIPHPPNAPRVASLTVDDFLLLDRSGTFDRYHKTELINGSIIVVNAQFSEHLTVKIEILLRLNDACKALGSGLRAWSEASIDMSPDGLPQPDLFITNERPTTGAVRLETVILIAEVSDTTLALDLGDKADLYVRHGVPEYWVIDVEGRTVRQMWSPEGERYAEQRDVLLGGRLEAATIPGLAVDTSGI